MWRTARKYHKVKSSCEVKPSLFIALDLNNLIGKTELPLQIYANKLGLLKLRSPVISSAHLAYHGLKMKKRTKE